MTEWLVGYTKQGRLVHAVRTEGPGFVTYCGHNALPYRFGAWADRDEDMLWCTKCDTGLPINHGEQVRA